MINLKYAVAGLGAFGALALGSGSAPAMPNGFSAMPGPNSNIENVRMVCNAWGRCWWRPNYYVGPVVRYGYGGPRYYRGGRGYHRGWGRRW
jgi:hypothetical protein